MAAITQRGSRWQIRVRHALLPKPYFDTFATEEEARAYATQLESLLDRGILPSEMASAEKRGADPTLARLLEAYQNAAPIAPSDAPVVALLADTLAQDFPGLRLSGITAAWADDWVAKMKTGGALAPSTIRKRVGSLARAIDWHWRQHKDGQPPVNALRLMPRGFSQYDAKAPEVRADVQRNRRLSPEEEAAVRQVLAGHKRPDRERAYPADADLALLFELILHTGLRLREAYSLRVDQVDLGRWVLNVEGTKGERGKAKPRVVPLVRELRAPLAVACADRVGRIFTFWDGTPEDKALCTGRLSARFATLFDYAALVDFTEHDLRHEATCRWVTLRDAAGRWVFSELEICKIMGWSDPKMMLRYASLRAEDLSARLG
ncbi:MAG: site-specific integrase [Burkholderiaceae bacterium]